MRSNKNITDMESYYKQLFLASRIQASESLCKRENGVGVGLPRLAGISNDILSFSSRQISTVATPNEISKEVLQSNEEVFFFQVSNWLTFYNFLKM